MKGRKILASECLRIAVDLFNGINGEGREFRWCSGRRNNAGSGSGPRDLAVCETQSLLTHVRTKRMCICTHTPVLGTDDIIADESVHNLAMHHMRCPTTVRRWSRRLFARCGAFLLARISDTKDASPNVFQKL